MEGKRVIIILAIVLIFLAVLFAVGIGWGVRNDGKQENEMTAEEFSEQPNPFPWTERFGQWLGPFTPKLKLVQSRYVVSAGSSLAGIEVPQDLENSFRTGTFYLRSGLRAVVVYRANVETDGALKNPQELELPRKKRDENDDPRRGTLAIVKAGGILEIRCFGTVPCTVEIE
jgi:hypothetical protein